MISVCYAVPAVGPKLDSKVVSANGSPTISSLTTSSFGYSAS